MSFHLLKAQTGENQAWMKVGAWGHSAGCAGKEAGVRGVPGAQGLPRPGSDDGEQSRPCPWVVVLPSGSWAVAFLQSSPECHFLGVPLLLRLVSRFPFAFPVLSQLGARKHWEGAGHGRCGPGEQGKESLRKPLQLGDS